MEKPLISFCLPTYDRVAWVGETIQSLIEQTEKNIEIVVVDDFSKDGTRELLDSLSSKDDRIAVIYNKENLGAGKSRNIAMNIASAPIIGICDSDDTYPNDRAEVTLKWFKEHPESELVQTPYMRVDYFGGHLEAFWGSEFDYEGFKKDGTVNYFCNPSVGVKTKSLMEIGGYPSEKEGLTDDVQMVRNWLNAGKKIDFDKTAFGVLHRVMPNSMMSKQRGWSPQWVGAK